MTTKYHDRSEAGKVLAEQLKTYANRKDVIVLGLPRGGVPVAYEVAQALRAPLDVFIVRKLGVPGREELAMGAIASGDVTVFNDGIVRQLNIPKTMIDKVIHAEREELNRREQAYRGNRPFPELAKKTVILVDDGIATGATIRASVKAIREFNPTKIIIAVPVADTAIGESLSKVADEVVCPLRPEHLYAVGAWYDNFDQTTDTEVYELLAQAQS